MGRFGRKENRRRGFRIVLWTMGLFVLAQVLGGLVLDYLWIRVRFPWQADMYEILQARARPPEILFLGSSRFGCTWDCNILDAGLRQELGEQSPRTFNCSLPYGDPTVCERVFDDLLHMGYRPKMVVVEVNPVGLARRDNWLNQQALRLLDWRDVPEAFQALCRNGKIMYLVRGRLLPLYLHRYQLCKGAVAKLDALFHPQPVRTPADPPVQAPVQADPEPPPPLAPAVLAQIKASCDEVSRGVKNFQIGGVASGRLERLLDRCRSLGIAVLLVQPPVSSHYRQAIGAQADGIFAEYIRMLAQRYGCRYCDWSDRLPDLYFKDEHHAFVQGGVYVSRRFGPEVLAPFWRDVIKATNETNEGKPNSNSSSL